MTEQKRRPRVGEVWCSDCFLGIERRVVKVTRSTVHVRGLDEFKHFGGWMYLRDFLDAFVPARERKTHD